MKILCGFLLALCFTFQVKGQNHIEELNLSLSVAESTIDSIDILVQLVDSYLGADNELALQYLEQVKVLSEKASDAYGVATYFLLRGISRTNSLSFQSAKLDLLNSARIADSIDYNQGLELAYSNLATLFSRMSLLDSTVYYYEKTYEIAQDSLGKADAINGLALTYRMVGAYEDAANYFFEVLKLTESSNHYYKTSVFLNLSMTFNDQGLIGEAERYAKMSILEARKSQNDAKIAHANGHMGMIQFSAERLDSAIYYLENSTNVFERINDNYHSIEFGLALFSVYTEMGDYQSAQKVLKKQKNKLSPDSSPALIVNMNLAQARFNAISELFPLSVSVDLLNDAKYLIDKYQLNNLLPNFHDVRSTVFESSEPAQALIDFRRYKELNDSLANIKSKNYVTLLQTKYETEKKDTEIASLSQQAQIQALELSQRNTQLAIAGVVILVIVLAGFIFYQQRQHKHHQAVSNMEQRMLRLQMNPHFIFNALSSIQNYILRSDTKESVKYLSKFGKLMRQILEHSREEFITIEEEVDMLTNYLQIQQLRFAGAFDYQINVSEELDQSTVKIPPLFAQPLVENAIEHGLAGIENGLVTISFSKTDSGVSLQVSDNGRGMEIESSASTDHKSLATIITRERLSILSNQYKTKFLLNHQSQKAVGTSVDLIIPSIA